MKTAMQLLAEGKTKRIFKTENPRHAIIEYKDDVTAGDGVKHDVLAGKGLFSNQTNANVFRLLKACAIPVAFVEEVDETHFLAELCEMIPYEVVVRREAHGSFLKRYSGFQKGEVFQPPLLEFFLKTSGKKWNEIALPADDPFLRFVENRAMLYLPAQPIHQQKSFLVLEEFPLKESPDKINQVGKIAIAAFLVLERAWQILGMKLVDFKVEFGINGEGEIRLADVIDNDSWRVLDNGKHVDKQLYRDGAGLDTVTEKYRLVRDLTNEFEQLHQEIVFWWEFGSKSDVMAV